MFERPERQCDCGESVLCDEELSLFLYTRMKRLMLQSKLGLFQKQSVSFSDDLVSYNSFHPPILLCAQMSFCKMQVSGSSLHHCLCMIKEAAEKAVILVVVVVEGRNRLVVAQA